MKQILDVEINKNKKYAITISDENMQVFAKSLEAAIRNRKKLFVISKKVYKLYKHKFPFNPDETIIINDGEKEKNINNYVKILKKAAQLKLTRKDVFIAFGGGVIGDITGFAASTYMRGIDFIQVPTTLLAMVDSSVGGKTAINLEEGKNLVGTFYQPKAVFVNLNFLETLDERQYLSGIGEILKYAFIEESCGYSQPLFLLEYLTLSANNLLERDAISIFKIIEYCLRLKIAVVDKDEKEAGLRKILNFGHTLGHAIETITNYKKFAHGEAVIYGMMFIMNIALKQQLITNSYYKQAVNLFEKYGFSEMLPLKQFGNSEEFVDIMENDKKATSGKITFIAPCAKATVKEVQYTAKEVLNMLEMV